MAPPAAEPFAGGVVAQLLTPDRAKALREQAEARVDSARTRLTDAVAFERGVRGLTASSKDDQALVSQGRGLAHREALDALRRFVDAHAALGRARADEARALAPKGSAQ